MSKGEKGSAKTFVCPFCGTVTKEGKQIGQAYGLSPYLRQGYLVKLCPECEGKQSGNIGETKELLF